MTISIAHARREPAPAHRSRRRPTGARLLTLAATVLALVALVGVGPASALSGQTRLHDPTVIKVGDCYYGYSTGFERDPANPTGQVTMHRSCGTGGVSGWTALGPIFSSTPAWITSALGRIPPNIWAPDVFTHRGTYYLYYAASIWGQSTSAVMGLATASSPTGPWTDRGMVTNVNYPIDPNIAWGPDGRQYMAWGSFNGIYMHVMDAGTGKLSTTDHNLWKLATGIENPTIVLNGGWYYLFGSRGLCCSGVNSTYYTVVGRSQSITGPYLDQAGKPMASGGGTTVLTGASPRVAAGGGDAFDDGTAKRLAYHYYDANNNGRETLDIRTITFANGWPVMGPPAS